jgi:hypothetical protein
LPLKIISNPELDRLSTWNLLIAQEAPHQLQFGLFEELAFDGNDLALVITESIMGI